MVAVDPLSPSSSYGTVGVAGAPSLSAFGSTVLVFVVTILRFTRSTCRRSVLPSYLFILTDTVPFIATILPSNQGEPYLKERQKTWSTERNSIQCERAVLRVRLCFSCCSSTCLRRCVCSRSNLVFCSLPMRSWVGVTPVVKCAFGKRTMSAQA